MGRNNNILREKVQKIYITFWQLKSWKIKFHRVYFSKPYVDYYIDYKFLFEKYWGKLLQEKFIKRNK